MSIQRPLNLAEQPLGPRTLWIPPPKASIMSRVILKVFPAVRVLIQSVGNEKADPSQYTRSWNAYGIMHSPLSYAHSDRLLSEPIPLCRRSKRLRGGGLQIPQVTVEASSVVMEPFRVSKMAHLVQFLDACALRMILGTQVQVEGQNWHNEVLFLACTCAFWHTCACIHE